MLLYIYIYYNFVICLLNSIIHQGILTQLTNSNIQSIKIYSLLMLLWRPQNDSFHKEAAAE